MSIENAILYYLPPYLIENLKTTKAIIAGGFITSIYNQTKIEDIDIFFKNEDMCNSFHRMMEFKNNYGIASSRMAIEYEIIYHCNKIKLHTINGLFEETPENLFKTFDFTVCMGAYSFEDNKLHFHEKFREDNDNKYLRINYSSPSLLRLQSRLNKYLFNKGFFLHEKEYRKLKIFLSSTPYSELFKRYNDYFKRYDNFSILPGGNCLHKINWLSDRYKKDGKYGYHNIKRHTHRLSKRIQEIEARYEY